MKNQELGARGEYLARLYLEKKGFVFLRANYRTRFGEIDLIMQENDEIVFIEVKTRTVQSAKTFGRGALRIDEKKQESIFRAARHFMNTETRLTKDLTPRFDAAELYLNPENEVKIYILHTPCAFGV